MKIIEILLSRKNSDKDIQSATDRKIDMIRGRIDSYVDKIHDPSISRAGREFLKSRIRAEYDELRKIIPQVRKVAEDQPISQKYEVYDRRTGETVAGPYLTSKRARNVMHKMDTEYGAVRYGYRPVGGWKESVMEAVHKLPLTDADFETVCKVMERPIPAAVAPIFISEIIDDDELNDTLRELEESNPGMDVRPIIGEWFNRVMPDQMHRFGQEVAGEKQRMGILSPIHGYDPKMYKGTNDPITGNAYGMR